MSVFAGPLAIPERTHSRASSTTSFTSLRYSSRAPSPSVAFGASISDQDSPGATRSAVLSSPLRHDTRADVFAHQLIFETKSPPSNIAYDTSKQSCIRWKARCSGCHVHHRGRLTWHTHLPPLLQNPSPLPLSNHHIHSRNRID